MYKSKYISNNLTEEEEEEAPSILLLFFSFLLQKKYFPTWITPGDRTPKNITFNLKCLNEKL